MGSSLRLHVRDLIEKDLPEIGWSGGPLHPRGIGSYLIEAAEQRIRGRGLSVAELSVEEENVRARALYERLGYTDVGTETASWETETPSGDRRPTTRSASRCARPSRSWQIANPRRPIYPRSRAAALLSTD